MNLKDTSPEGVLKAEVEYWRDRCIAGEDKLPTHELPQWKSSLADPPKEGQEVVYYFEPFETLYAGIFDGIAFTSQFGFCDKYDAPFWMNRHVLKEDEMKSSRTFYDLTYYMKENKSMETHIHIMGNALADLRSECDFAPDSKAGKILEDMSKALNENNEKFTKE